MPPQRVSTASPPTSSYAGQPHPVPGGAKRSPESSRFAPTPEEGEEASEEEESYARHVRKGTMSKDFRFPPPNSQPQPPPVPAVPTNLPSPPKDDTPPAPSSPPDRASKLAAAKSASDASDVGLSAVGMVAPSTVEVPPPPPVEKEPSPNSVHDAADDEVGETEEISLN